jgi:glycosyltransferase involved in cell wall biosynthesis
VPGSNVTYLKLLGDLWGKNPVFFLLPYIWRHRARIDLIHAHSYIHFSTMQAVLAGWLLGIPVVVTLHGGVTTKSFVTKSIGEKLQLLVKNLVFDRLLGRLTIQLPDALISVSRSDLLAIGDVFHVNRVRNYYIPNAVEMLRFSATRTADRPYSLLFVGRLSNIKGADRFVEIVGSYLAKRPNDRVLILGDGDYRSEVEALAAHPNVDHVRGVPPEEMPGIYAQCRVLVITSRFEGLPTTMLEAMASGTLVFTTPVGGIPDVIKPGENGFLHDYSGPLQAADELAVIAQRLDAGDPALQEMVAEALSTIRKQFTWKSVARKNYLVYRKVLANRTTRKNP